MSIIRQLARVANRIDSASTGTFLSKGDSTGDFTLVNYTDLSGRPTTLDSAALTSLVDSAYIQLRQTSAGSGGLDSAAITALVDSNYVIARSPAASSGFANYEYTATAGQTTFQDSDINGNVMSYTADGIFVFYNGVLIAPTTDYTASDGSSVVLTTGADSGSHVAISKWSIASGGAAAGIAWGGDRGIVYVDPYSTPSLDYFDITTPSNAANFGNLSVSHGRGGSASDTTYGLIAGGGGYNNYISYNTIATLGNGSDFGDLTVARREFSNGSADGTYGLFWNGATGTTTQTNTIDYVTVATPSNATDFGDTSSTAQAGAATNDATRGVGFIGYTTAVTNIIEYVTIATPSNSSDFGDLTIPLFTSSAASDETYALRLGGATTSYARTNVIDYITVQTASNATDFGDLLAAAEYLASTSNGTYAVTAGGNTGSDQNVIQYVTIATPSNSTDFGDLTIATSQIAAYSGSPS